MLHPAVEEPMDLERSMTEEDFGFVPGHRDPMAAFDWLARLPLTWLHDDGVLLPEDRRDLRFYLSRILAACSGRSTRQIAAVWREALVEAPGGSVQIVIEEMTAVLPLGEVIDLAKERERLKREVAKVDAEIAKFQKKLANEQFLAKAPEEVIEEQKERQGEAVQTRDKLAAALERLASA